MMAAQDGSREGIVQQRVRTGRALRGAAHYLLRGGGDAPGRGAEALGRLGLVAYGCLHFLLAGLASDLLLDARLVRDVAPGAAAAEVGALGSLGYVLIAASAVGFAALVVWQVLAAARGFRWVSGGERTRKRVGAAAKSIAGTAAAIAILPVLAGEPITNSGLTVREWARVGLALPGGRLWIALAAGVVLFVAASMLYTGFWATYMGDLWRHRVPQPWRSLVILCGSWGTLARAAVLGGVGVLLVSTAHTADPDRAGSFTRVLRALNTNPLGTVTLVLIIGGVAAFGIYCVIDAYARRA